MAVWSVSQWSEQALCRGKHGPGSARRRLATRGRRAALNTGKSSLKCHFWPICSSVSRRPISHTVPIAGEWLSSITVSYMMILAGVYWWTIHKKTNGDSNITPHSYFSQWIIPNRVTGAEGIYPSMHLEGRQGNTTAKGLNSDMKLQWCTYMRLWPVCLYTVGTSMKTKCGDQKSKDYHTVKWYWTVELLGNI